MDGSVIPQEPGLRAALAIQARVTWALVLRETRTRFGKNQLGYIWAVLEPCLHISVWFCLFLFISNKTGNSNADPLLILTTGILPFFLFRRIYTFMARAISSNQALLHYPMVRHIDLVGARFILEGATMMFVSFFIIIIVTSLGIVPIPNNALKLLTAIGAVLWLALGFGAFNSVMTILSPTYDKILGITGRLLYFTSGIHYLAEQLPKEVVRYLSYNPILHGVELFREGYIYNYHSSFASFGYMGACGMGFLLIAMLLERVAGEQLREP